MFCGSVQLTPICRGASIINLREKLREFVSLDNVERSYVLACELWEESFESLLALVKDYMFDLREVRIEG